MGSVRLMAQSSNVMTTVGLVLMSALAVSGCSSCRHSRSVVLGDGKGHGAWRDVEYDENVEACKVNFNVDDVDRHILRRVAESYPNLKVLQVEEELHYDKNVSVDLDCSELLLATNVVIVEISNLAGRVKNIEAFCRDPRKRIVKITASPGEHIYYTESICQLPETPSEDEIKEFASEYGGNCAIKIKERCGFFSSDRELRSVYIKNTGTGIVALKKIPKFCNHLALTGDFDLSSVEICEQINALSWICKAQDFQKKIAEIVPTRFPNLHFLHLCLDAEIVCEIDLSSLARFSSMKTLDFWGWNVIPIGVDELYTIDDFWGGLNSCFLYRLDNGVKVDPEMELWPGDDNGEFIECVRSLYPEAVSE